MSYRFLFAWASVNLGGTMISHNTTETSSCVLDGADCKVLQNLIMVLKYQALNLIKDHEILHLI
jgi:hypothetical protein